MDNGEVGFFKNPPENDWLKTSNMPQKNILAVI
jgi:hypothetical protein